MLYLKVVRRENSKSSHHKEKIFFYFLSFASIGYEGFFSKLTMVIIS